MLAVERFWYKVDVRGPDECWLWRTDTDDYGKFNVVRGGRLMGAHRFSWILANREDIPDGLFVLHSCDNKRCVNPAHLSLGTAAQNAREAYERGLLAHLPAARAARGPKDECRRRHKLEGNAYVGRDGRRRCKTCHAMRQKKYRTTYNEYRREWRKRRREMDNNGNPNNHTLEWAN